MKFSNASWTRDGKGFFYSRYDEPKAGEALSGTNFYQKLYFHKLGTPQAQDSLVYERKDQKEWGIRRLRHRRRALPAHLHRARAPSPRTSSSTRTCRTPRPRWWSCCPGGRPSTTASSNDGPLFCFKTDLDAPRGRVIAIDLRKPERKDWKEVIPQGEDTLDVGEHGQ